MYVRGFFKLGQVPTALAGTLMLALALAAGLLHTSWRTSYRRELLALPPWLPALQPANTSIAAHAPMHHDPSGPPVMQYRDNGVLAAKPNATPQARSALLWAYALNCAAIAIAIFHAGVFPLYRYSSRSRYWHELQDALASFGWSFLSLHHVANVAVLLLLTYGPAAVAAAAPFVLLLPAAHYSLRLLPKLPPSLHFHMGVYVDLATHVPLALLYLWRAWVLNPWELIGTGAELLHLASVLPETWAHKSRPWKLDAEEDGPSPSCENPWGQPDDSKDEEVDGPLDSQSTCTADSADAAGMKPAAGLAALEAYQDLRQRQKGGAGARLEYDAKVGGTYAAAPAGPEEEEGVEQVAATKGHMAGKAGRRPSTHKPLPVYPLLVLINCASFFCYGGLMALSRAA